MGLADRVRGGQSRGGMRALLLLALLLPACATGDPGSDLDPDRFTEEACAEPDAVRCLGGVRHQSCQDWLWYDEETCQAGSVCAEGLGCVDCNPFEGPTCVGDDVWTCGDDGSLGTYVETCAVDHCQLGYCRIEDCPDGTDLVYVVDTDYHLLAFDPRGEAYSFELLGNLGCPAGAPWPGWGTFGAASPFSMSVDRQGTAWVLYTSGEIFWIPIQDVEDCRPSNWVPGTDGFELFGMGFVTDSPFSTDETLFLAGGTVSQMATQSTGRLGAYTPDQSAFDVRGSLSSADHPPELTGTGAGELYGYFPSELASTVARISKSTGQNGTTWGAPGLGSQVRAWAFAHWGGDFFVFVSFTDFETGIVNQVQRFDPKTGETTVVVENSPYRVVGAGVSTCAPLVVQ